MSEDAHQSDNGPQIARGTFRIPPRPPQPLGPALTHAAWQTSHLHLCLAHAKISQAVDVLKATNEAGRLCNELLNVANWLDDTALRITGQATEASRL